MNELLRAPSSIGKLDTLFAKRDGQVLATNKRRMYETPFVLMTNEPLNTLTVAPANASPAAAMRVSAEGPMQLTMFGALRDSTHGEVMVRMYMRDGTATEMLMNAPCHIDTIFGPGGNMYTLPEGLFIDEQRALSVICSSVVDILPDPPPDPTLARIVAVGAKYSQLEQDPQLARIKERLSISQFISTPYFYTINGGFADIHSLQTTEVEIEIGTQHNFEIHQFSAKATGTFSLDIIDVTKGASIINAPRGTHYAIPSTMLLGDGSHPYKLHEPVMVFAGQRLLVTLTDTSGLDSQTPNRVYLTLGGRAIKPRMWS